MARIQIFATAMLAAGLALGSAAAQAQTQTSLENGINMTLGSSGGVYDAIDLGSTSGSSWVTQMPMTLSYAGVDVDIAFSGASGVMASGGGWNPTPGQNYFAAAGSMEMQFSTAQNVFGLKWSSPDDANKLSFYNGSQLLASMTGAQFRALTGTPLLTRSTDVEFSFSEVGFTRVVAESPYSGLTTDPQGGFEFGGVRFGDSPAVAPIPLNAASMGGLMSFLMMLGMWGKGGTRHMLRMTFASITPRRRAAGLA